MYCLQCDGCCDFIATLSPFDQLFLGEIDFIQGRVLRGDIDGDRFHEFVVRFHPEVRRRQISANDCGYGRFFDRLFDEAERLGYSLCIDHEANMPDEDDEYF